MKMKMRCLKIKMKESKQQRMECSRHMKVGKKLGQQIKSEFNSCVSLEKRSKMYMLIYNLTAIYKTIIRNIIQSFFFLS